MTNKPNLLFYSLLDKESIDILNLLKTYKIYNYFKLFNVDENKNHIVLQKIKKIPTAIIPDEKLILVGQDIINYLKSNIIQSNNILGYNDIEMNGYSDKYSFINSNISPIHNYGLFNKPLINNNNNIKKNELNDEMIDEIILQHNKNYNL